MNTGSMGLIFLKALLTPSLIGLVSVAGRRWGPAVSGLLVGLLSFASFCLVAGLLIVPAGILPAFAAAIIATVAVQGASQWLFARRREPRYA
ncbi:MAG TPA: hypothetical protein VFW76_05795 [Ktedonobacterales bacterium]|nr:hypothetical protein [Ktedonobacterales bacterium]